MAETMTGFFACFSEDQKVLLHSEYIEGATDNEIGARQEELESEHGVGNVAFYPEPEDL